MSLDNYYKQSRDKKKLENLEKPVKLVKNMYYAVQHGVTLYKLVFHCTKWYFTVKHVMYKGASKQF